MINNVRVPSAKRPMTTAEKYYAFLDLVWPSNPILSADLAVCLPADEVEAKWAQFCARRICNRLMPTSDLTVVDAGLSRVAFSTATLPRAEWAAQVARDADTAFGLERVTRLHYLTSPDEGRSFMYLVGHHSIVDGRGGLLELQAFLRFLDGRDVPVQNEISVPSPGRAEYPWQTDRRALLALLRDLSAHNRELGEPLPESWPPASAERAARCTPITLSPQESEVVLTRARTEGVRVFSSMASAWLGTVAHSMCGSDDGVLQLNVPVDRSVTSVDPRRPTAMAVGVIAHRYHVRAGEQWTLAREVAATVERALARGEGELFFHLARLDNIADLAKGAELVEAGITTAAPAVSVTNIGVLDPSDDPPWVLGMWGNLAATPNQLVSFSTVGYRGRLCCSLWTDDRRVNPGVTTALAFGFRDALR